MNETIEALLTIFMLLFMFFQIKIINRIIKLRRIRKYQSDLSQQGSFSEILDGSLCCCCLECIDCFECHFCSDLEVRESYKDLEEQQHANLSDKDKAELIRLRTNGDLQSSDEIKTNIKQKYLALKESGFIPEQVDTNKIADIISIYPKINLEWTSMVTRIPIEKIMIIIENEPEYEIRDVFIVNIEKLKEIEELEKERGTEKKWKYWSRVKYSKDEEMKVIKLLANKRKASIWWLRKTANISEEKVVSIFSDKPGYLIMGEYIYNEMLMKGEDILKTKERIVGMKLCPDCENPIDEGTIFCPNCGYNLNE